MWWECWSKAGRQVVCCHYLFAFQSLFCFQLNVLFQENNWNRFSTLSKVKFWFGLPLGNPHPAGYFVSDDKLKYAVIMLQLSCWFNLLILKHLFMNTTLHFQYNFITLTANLQNLTVTCRCSTCALKVQLQFVCCNVLLMPLS